MSKKYIYSEAKIIKEFLGNILTNIIANKHSNIVRDIIKNDPIVKRYNQEVQVATDKDMKRIEHKRKQDTDYNNRIKRLRKKATKLT